MSLTYRLFYQTRCIPLMFDHQFKITSCCSLFSAPAIQKIYFSSSNVEPMEESKIRKRPKSKYAIVNWFYDDILKSKIKINAFFLYAGITHQINYLQFFKTFEMDDTFNSWYLITELHVWMLLARLRGEGKNGRTSSASLVAAMWDDTGSRSKALSPGDITTSRKQIQVLGREFKASLMIYDEGLLSSDTVLASALWYRLLSQSCDDPRLLEMITAYVRYQVHNLDNTSIEQIMTEPNLKWKPLSAPQDRIS